MKRAALVVAKGALWSSATAWKPKSNGDEEKELAPPQPPSPKLTALARSKLPGSAAGDLVARQVWWIGTAAASAAGLYGLLRLQSIGARIGSLILIAIPHLVGAPHPAKYESTVPAELAAHFAASSLALTAAMWMLIACAVGMIWERSAHRA